MNEHASDNSTADTARNPTGLTGQTRREIVRTGVKIAFAAPVLSTFFAADAYAARYSCYPIGHACGAATEPCCGTACPGGGAYKPCKMNGFVARSRPIVVSGP